MPSMAQGQPKSSVLRSKRNHPNSPVASRFRALESGEIVHIHPASVLFRSKPECVIFNELMQTSQKYIKNLTRIDPLWLAELAPHHYKTQE
ncbi:hypothetical protein DY000_02008574 [Brassica cretica]|uniref:DEAD-box helicase OB fold domain-containing protein n=1 Tax=Brassica cretica TaxID=69181 RepID=A0ABQ7CCT9_BRACR|nr:hypothetical protein DY000_02008574 [Brassica cretica]